MMSQSLLQDIYLLLDKPDQISNTGFTMKKPLTVSNSLLPQLLKPTATSLLPMLHLHHFVELADQTPFVLVAVDGLLVAANQDMLVGFYSIHFFHYFDPELELFSLKAVYHRELSQITVTSQISFSLESLMIVAIPAIMYLFIISLPVIRCMRQTRLSKSRRQFLPPQILLRIETILPSKASWHLR